MACNIDLFPCDSNRTLLTASPVETPQKSVPPKAAAFLRSGLRLHSDRAACSDCHYRDFGRLCFPSDQFSDPFGQVGRKFIKPQANRRAGCELRCGEQQPIAVLGVLALDLCLSEYPDGFFSRIEEVSIQPFRQIVSCADIL